MLFMLGSVQFDVAPTNIHALESTAGQDWAEKPLVGASPDFEATGPQPNITKMSGRLITDFFGAGGLDALKQMARSSSPFMLIRGDGTVLGWQVIHTVVERHTYLNPSGVGRIVEFDIALSSTPNGPTADALLTLLQGLF
jgi:uncharacterized protein